MSVLETPRVYFSGQISWDPIVTNNYQQYYDENAADPLPIGVSAAQFRATAIQDVTAGNWNPDGTHRSTFFETRVTGVDLGNGVTLDDPFVSAPIGFTGMLVDCEPYGAYSSQLFFDAISFGISGGCRILCPAQTRMIARYINFSRNGANGMIAGVASVVWQTSFPTGSLTLDVHDSQAITALSQALTDEKVLGLTVRWNSYRTVYFDDPSLRNGSPATTQAETALQQKLLDGGWQPNPARSLLVGVLGLWREGEPAQEPGDRALLAIPPAEPVATAHARLSPDALTIDLANSIPEVDTNLTKQDFGTLTVAAGSTPLGTIPYAQYARAAYEQTAGIVTMKMTPEGVAAAAAPGAIITVKGGDGTTLLEENAVRAVPAFHNVYVGEGEQAALLVQVLSQGAPAGKDIEIRLYQADSGGNNPVLIGSDKTDSSGLASFSVDSVPGGAVTSYIFVPPADPAPSGIDTQITTYAYVRTLPADDAIGAMQPTWQNVYNNVLVKWHAMAPCMDNWLRFDDEAQVRRYGPMIKALTDPGAFESYRFMPVVRDMTKGERTLLYNFLDTQPPAALGAEAIAEAEPDPHIAKLDALSHAMRSPLRRD